MIKNTFMIHIDSKPYADDIFGGLKRSTATNKKRGKKTAKVSNKIECNQHINALSQHDGDAKMPVNSSSSVKVKKE